VAPVNERRDEETVTEINVEVDSSALGVAQGTKHPPDRRPAFSSSGHEDPTRRRKIPFPAVEELESEPAKEALPQLGDRVDTEETTAQGYVGARPLPNDARWVRKKAMTMLGLGPHGARGSAAKTKRDGAVKPNTADLRATADTIDAETTEPTLRRKVVSLEPEQITDTSVMSEPELVSALIAAADAADAVTREDEVLPSHELRTDPGTGSDPAIAGPTFPKRAPALSQLPTVPRPFSPKKPPAERAELEALPPPSIDPAAAPSTSEAAVVVAQAPLADAAPPSSRRRRRAVAAAALGGALLCAGAAVLALRATGDGDAPAPSLPGAADTAASHEEAPPGTPSAPGNEAPPPGEAEPAAAQVEPEPVAAQPEPAAAQAEAPEASPADKPATAAATAPKTASQAPKARVARPARAPKRAVPKARTTAPPPPKGFEPSAI
jgi:hypothetical protein